MCRRSSSAACAIFKHSAANRRPFDLLIKSSPISDPLVVPRNAEKSLPFPNLDGTKASLGPGFTATQLC